jgi:protein-S-isoprenylcysteine O-methyltransferase Ste14
VARAASGGLLLALKNLLFTVVVPGTVAVYVPLWIAGDRLRGGAHPGAALGGLGALLLAVGAAIYGWCLWDFASFGRGTPAPIDAPRHLVIRGLYRHVRNPMYVGVLTVILGWAALLAAPSLVVYAAIVLGMFQTFIVLYEEPTLKRLFGAEYERYRAEVPRWLPRRRRAPR